MQVMVLVGAPAPDTDPGDARERERAIGDQSNRCMKFHHGFAGQPRRVRRSIAQVTRSLVGDDERRGNAPISAEPGRWSRPACTSATGPLRKMKPSNRFVADSDRAQCRRATIRTRLEDESQTDCKKKLNRLAETRQYAIQQPYAGRPREKQIVKR